MAEILNTVTSDIVQLVNVAAQAAADKKATNLVAFEVADRMPLTDVFLVLTADNERQVAAIVEEIEDRLREQGCKTLRREGFEEKRWVLLDFGDLVVHIQVEEEREYYALDRLWGDCPQIELTVQA